MLVKARTAIFDRSQVCARGSGFVWARQSPIKSNIHCHSVILGNGIAAYLHGSPKAFEDLDPPINNKSGKAKLPVDLRILLSMKRYLWPKDKSGTKARVVFSVVLLTSGKLLSLGVPWFFKLIVDDVSGMSQEVLGSEPTLSLFALTVLVGYGAARFASTALQELRNAVFSYVSQQSSRMAALELFEHIHKLDMSFHKSVQTGALMRVLDRGSKGVGQILTSIVFHVVPTFLEVLFVCGLFGIKLGPLYSVVIAATVGAYSLFTFSVTTWRLRFRKAMNALDNRASSVATDSFLNAEVVKYHDKIDHECRKYEKHLVEYEKTSIKTINSLSYLNAGQSAITSLAITILMWMARDDICNGLLTPGDLVLANGLLFQLSIPLNFLGTTYRDARQSLIDMQAMHKILNLRPRIEDDDNKTPLIVTNGSIKFDNISFGYTPRKNVIHNMSFEVEGGSSVAFIGPSGCGKSTIIRLISLSLLPISGSIYIDGQNIESVSSKSLRESISVVPQDSFLFNDTLEYNISYGGNNASMEQVSEAAKAASIHDEIVTKFKDGYNTVVGERGGMLSGGEKQRVQLARAFLKNAPINLFDEYTTALDAETESKVNAATQNFLKNKSSGKKKTSIFVAHKLSSIVNCDKIFLIDNGVIIDSGTHSELIDNSCLYAQMWSKQSSSPLSHKSPCENTD